LPLILIVVVGGLIGLFLIGNRGMTTPTPAATSSLRDSPNGLPGLVTTDAPWSNNAGQLSARLTALNLPQLTTEGSVLHIHQHIDIFVHGKAIAIPALIGIPNPESFISIIHTHDASGLIHVESPVKQDYYLGEFFDIWGVEFDQTHLGGYTPDATNQLLVYINGVKAPGDWRKIVLAAHQEIVVTYGTLGESPATIPASYSFAAGD
jgi:hypothetical protein